MKAKRDFSCEIIALIVLTALSALSHFWLILIAIFICAAIVGVGILLSNMFLYANKEMLARFHNPLHREETRPEPESSVRMAREPRPSLPVA